MIPFSEEQLRTLVNLGQVHDHWVRNTRERRKLGYGMHWKTISGRDYLYETSDRKGNGRSLGPRAPETEEQFKQYQARRLDFDSQIADAQARVQQNAKIARALRLPGLAQEAGKILVEFDVREMLGTSLMVVGTNAILAYDLEAAGTLIIGADMATDDFDLLWSRDHSTSLMTKDASPSILEALKQVDATYTVNEERPFQLRNRNAYEIEVLVPPSRIDALPKGDRIRPALMEETEWLLLGLPVDQVVPVKGDSAARIIAPDPRMFALQKLWLSEKRSRNSLKKPKDRRQGDALLDACAVGSLPRHPLDAAFVESLPGPLVRHYERWASERKFGSAAKPVG